MKKTKQKYDFDNQSLVEIRTMVASERKRKDTSDYHYHSFCQVVIVQQGSVTFLVDSISVVVNNSSVLMLGNELPHGVVSISDDAIVTVIHVQYNVFSWIRDIVDMENSFNFIGNSRFGYIYSSRSLNKKLISLSHKIIKSNGFKRISIFFEILSFLQNDDSRRRIVLAENSIDPKNRVAKQTSVERVINYLYKNFDQELNLSLLSQIVNMNISSLCRAFKKKSGVTITNFINRLRIEKACQLLINTEMSISEIAFYVGYNSFSHFSSQFMRIVRQSPSDYRKTVNIQ